MLSKIFIFINILILLIFFTSFFGIGITPPMDPIIFPNIIPNLNSSKPTVLVDINYNQPIPILMFHSIANYSEIPINDFNPKLSHGLRIPPKILYNQLEQIKRNGYTTIKFEDLGNYIKYKQPLPANPIILTFDDGWADNTIAYNNLKELGMIGNFAIVSSFMDKPGRLTSTQVKEFNDNGMEISSHSVSHGNLSTMSAANLKNELVNSKKTLEELIGKEVNTIVYPTGAYNNSVIDAAKAAGYQFGTNTKGYADSQDLKKPFELTRVRVHCNVGSNIREDVCANLGGNFFLNLKK
jgi:peptidoglycan/xylan/chitin deacetylase (PgdA/CDA1 family)